jgi:DNA-binding MarR family transcriptional regulator
MASLLRLLKLMDSEKRGPSPGFSKEHALLVVMELGESGPIGRQSLARGSGVGEGSVRTILKKMRQAGLIRVDPAGIVLTDKGRSMYQAILAKITAPVTLPGSTLAVGKLQAAIAVRSPKGSVTNGIQQRDASIKAGADGATSLVIQSGKFAMPGGSSDCERDFASPTWATLRQELKPRDGDAVIVCGAKDETTAKLGALAAALTLV